jgi:gas vesicle protein
MNEKSFFFGALTGLIIGWLSAPESGRKTRQGMRTLYFEMKDRILEDMSEIKDISRETYENVVNSVVRGYEEARLVTSGEAAQIKNELKTGYGRIRTVLATPSKKV